MPNHFEATDPRGTKVICTEEQWMTHILEKHYWMKGREDSVRGAIEHPYIGVFQDATRSDRIVYYARIKKGKLYIKVVAEMTGTDRAEVVTAFQTDSPKRGEKLLWPRSSD